ncbi:MAG TPA: hypothetical protein VEJ84_16505, partial [Acidimicrobiales bacterium]|nr:hypothetical protein [Acidimicrobiales bacterium]
MSSGFSPGMVLRRLSRRRTCALPTRALLVVAALALALDTVLAGATSAACFGRGWCWPPTSDLTAAMVGVLVHPATPAIGWPASLSPRFPTATTYWCVFFVLATATVVLAAAAFAARSRTWPLTKRCRAGTGEIRASGGRLAVLLRAVRPP